MKFSEVEQEQWSELEPYLDTCLLPLTGLNGTEKPWEATKALEDLRDALETIELPFKGRVVTYPALHYVTGVDATGQINALTLQLKEAGFRFVIVLTAQHEAFSEVPQEPDLFITVNMNEWTSHAAACKSDISKQVQHLWYGAN
ncbi:DUF2487 family protein [Paenibacillus hexagrammi]|uniref:YpiF family protein n=1 Tax=Paenibacillus hexagrammi TaxID=2908839 RepID=A0ABY3SR59_9BACL|nr:DUF2487 family protein [Paenibacillus sp. YPD9-1]UJF36169.1 YpiF family protein [Paenibacillus sp. YPD9-1]